MKNQKRKVMTAAEHDEAVAAFLHKIREEIRLHEATQWRTSEEEQIWSGLGINTHAFWSCRFQDDTAYELEHKHDTTKYPVQHRWLHKAKETGNPSKGDGAAR